MHLYAWTALVTLVSLLVYLATIMRVGGARAKYKVPAPAMSGEPMFDRHFRVQMNTLESLPYFLPSLWLAALYWSDVWAAGIGAFWIVGRVIYMLAYVRDPGSRSFGFLMQALASIVLLFAALYSVVMTLLAAPAG